MKSKGIQFLVTHHISWLQLLGFLFSNIIGLFIISLGVQLYQDLSALFYKEDSLAGNEYLVVTKKVHSLSTIGSVLGVGSYKRFSAGEIEQLTQLKGVKRVGAFQTARYQVIASISRSYGAEGMASLLSFESIPDSFLDITPSEWSFDPNAPSIAIIVPKDFLTLYNFSMAESQGLPQLSESIIQQIPIDFQLVGDNGRVLYLKGRVVGFTQRINAFIVPEPFLQWSNEQLSHNQEQAPSRLMIEVEPSELPTTTLAIRESGYEIAGDAQKSSQIIYLFRIALSVVLFIGLLISLLAFFLLMLSVYLIMVKNRERIQTLYLIGYTPKEVGRTYTSLIWGINLIAWIAVIVALLLVRYAYTSYWEVLNTSAFNGLSVLFTLVFVLLFSVLQTIFLRRKLISYWH